MAEKTERENLGQRRQDLELTHRGAPLLTGEKVVVRGGSFRDSFDEPRVWKPTANRPGNAKGPPAKGSGVDVRHFVRQNRVWIRAELHVNFAAPGFGQTTDRKSVVRERV